MQFEAECRLDQLRWNFEQLSGQGEKLLVWQAAMAIVHRLGERKGNAGTDADQRGLLDAEFRRDLVGSAEADTADIAGEPVRVLRDESDGIGAIGLIDAH